MQTFVVAQTIPNQAGIERLLRALNVPFPTELAEDFSNTPGGLCSLMAKLCYRSIAVGANANISKVRDIGQNLEGVVQSRHGSVFEHFTLSFVSIGVSRVFTHELVRHRVGTAFSQTSGRYCTPEADELVLPEELDDIDLENLSVASDMRNLLELIKRCVARYRTAAGLDDPNVSFDVKKRITSALRRIMPNGVTNEIGWSTNVRQLRHMIELRTSVHAEWEIRTVFLDLANQLASDPDTAWVLMGGTQNCNKEWINLRI